MRKKESPARILTGRTATSIKAGVLVLGLALITGPAHARADDLAEFYGDPPEVKEWLALQKKGKEHLTLSEYGKAERTLKKAVLKARKLNPHDNRISESAGDLGRLLTIRGRFSEAEPYLEEELAFKDIAMDGDAGDLLISMGELVKFYLDYGTDTKADALTSDILDFVEGKIREQRNQKSGKLTLGKGQPLQGWAGTAAPSMRTPLIEWSVTCDALGEKYRIRKDYDTADRLFKAALDIKATVLGKKHLSLANSYDSLATLYQSKGDLAEAESYYRDSLEITEKILQPGDPQIYSRMNKLAKCLIREKKYGEAEKLYLRANAMYANSKSLYKQWALFNLGCLYSDQRRFSSAASVLSQAIHLAERNHGSRSVHMAPYLRKYAYVQYYLGNKGANSNLNARANSIAPVVKAITPKVKMGTLNLGSKDSKVN